MSFFVQRQLTTQKYFIVKLLSNKMKIYFWPKWDKNLLRIYERQIIGWVEP